jgi:hypothetical protein
VAIDDDFGEGAMRLAITGFPTAMASMTVWPKPSECEEEANPWRAWITLVDLGRIRRERVKKTWTASLLH